MLGGIALGQSESSVIATLGKPQRREAIDGKFLPITLVYRDFLVYLDDSGVGGALSTGKKFCTPAKVCPGMTYAQVTQIYGVSVSYETDGSISRDYFGEEGCWLRLTFEKERISSIQIMCAP
jgi:hypothetical protein